MSAEAIVHIRRALVSVSDKTEVESFSTRLAKQGVELLSTGGTRKFLEENRIVTRSVSDYTLYPEIMEGRVKTLHPRIHGGILARRGIDDKVMAEQGVEGIDLVVVNLYPFTATIAKPDCELSTAIENIDIGGPAMIRAAAKNYQHVVVVVDMADYAQVADEIEQTGGVCYATRFRLAAKAFAYTAEYDTAIMNYLTLQSTQQHGDQQKCSDHQDAQHFPRHLSLEFTKQADLRYGENPHQSAAFYVEKTPPMATLATAKQYQGKALSYNNIADTDAALTCVKSFEQTACVIVKHANPCGVALGNSVFEAYQRAFSADSTSAFGGIIAFNRMLDEKTAGTIITSQFVEVIIAPKVDDTALAILAAKPDIRVLSCGVIPDTVSSETVYKSVAGGLLVQSADQKCLTPASFSVVSRRQPAPQELVNLQFAWQVVKYVKSNAIVYAKNNQTIGIGAGQMSRVISAKIAAMKAEEQGLQVAGSVMASDAFFPFRDGIDAAAELGIRAVIQPGGSIRDQKVIEAANEYDMTMVFTGVRYFLH